MAVSFAPTSRVTAPAVTKPSFTRRFSHGAITAVEAWISRSHRGEILGIVGPTGRGGPHKPPVRLWPL
jgi:hypothetical protein